MEPRKHKSATPEPARVALYARISKADDAMGVKRQIKTLRRDLAKHPWLDRRDFEIVDVYVDNDKSAYDLTLVRPEFERLKVELESGRVNAVASHRLDRLYRQGLDYFTLLYIMEHKSDSLALLALDGDPRLVDIKTGEGMAAAEFYATMARSEVRSTISRVRYTQADLAEQGKASGGIRRFGYTADHMQVVPEEAAIIRDCATRHLGGESLSALARELNERGVPTVAADRWQTSRLRPLIEAEPREEDSVIVKLVRQQVQDGAELKHVVIELNRSEAAPPPGDTKWKATNLGRILTGRHLIGKRTHNGEEFDAQWPAILTEDEHLALRALFDDPKRHTNRGQGGKKKYALAGLLKCGLCGATLYTRWVQGARLWTCVRVVGGCGRIARRSEPMEAWIIFDVLNLLDDPGTVKAILSLQDTAGDRGRLMKEIEEVTALKEELEVSYWDPQPGETRMEKGTYEMLKRRHDHRLSSTWTAFNRLNVDPNLVAEMRLRNFRDRWRTMALHRQQLLLKAVMEGTVVKSLGRGRRARTPHECYDIAWRF